MDAQATVNESILSPATIKRILLIRHPSHRDDEMVNALDAMGFAVHPMLAESLDFSALSLTTDFDLAIINLYPDALASLEAYLVMKKQAPEFPVIIHTHAEKADHLASAIKNIFDMGDGDVLCIDQGGEPGLIYSGAFPRTGPDVPGMCQIKCRI